MVPLLLEEDHRNEPKLPALIERLGPAGRFVWEEFFQGEIRNPYTRRNYMHAVRTFFSWLDARGVELVRVTPAHVGGYLDVHPGAAPTKKLHLTGIRRFFDKLVVRHLLVLNPAQSVRGPRYQTVEGRTPEISPQDTSRLFASIASTDIVSCRDRAIMALLVNTAVRVSAVAKLRMQDLLRDDPAWSVCFNEKGGKARIIPIREDMRRILSTYLEVAGLEHAPGPSPLFRPAIGKTKTLTAKPIASADIARMMKRRLRRASISSRYSPHSFRVTVITDLLLHGASLADVQNFAGHADPRTTQLYDRRQRRVTRNLVERITISFDPPSSSVAE